MIIKQKILQVMDDNYYSSEELSTLTGVSHVVIILALKGMLRNFQVIKFNGKYKRCDRADDLQTNLAMHVFVNKYMFIR